MSPPSTSSSDTLFISLYPDPSPDLPSGPGAGAGSGALPALQSLHLELLSHLSPFLSSHLFHHSPPSFSLSPSPLPHLHIRLPFADSLDDEWLLTSLIFSATKSLPNLTAHLSDSDGDFLLIEAAFSLPSWLNPDSSKNRVFLRAGELHIVPRQLFPEPPSLDEALAAVRNPRIDTRAPEKVQEALLVKISEYPDRALRNRHRARVRVPLSVAKVLRVEPCLVALAVKGFYERDLDSMRDAMRMERFLGGVGEVQMVRVAVGLTRAMYGQLVQQSFQAPRGYPMPGREEGPEAWLEAELGMKIACGFEMVYQGRRRAGEEGKGSTWEAFRESMERSGCFDGLLQGSKEYMRIFNNAEEYYKSTTLFSRTRYCCCV